MLRGAIFDLDGLMINSEGLALEAWQRSVAPYGASLTEAQYHAIIGLEHEATLRYVIEQLRLAISTEALDTIYQLKLVALLDSDLLQPMSGLLPLLDTLQERGFLLGIASNSATSRVRLATHRISVDERFTCIVSAEEVPQGKPAPDVYLEAARRLRLPPACCLAFEDSPSGLKAAQAAGLHCVFVPNPDLGITNLDGAEHVFPSLSACLAKLDQVLQHIEHAGQ